MATALALRCASPYRWHLMLFSFASRRWFHLVLWFRCGTFRSKRKFWNAPKGFLGFTFRSLALAHDLTEPEIDKHRTYSGRIRNQLAIKMSNWRHTQSEKCVSGVLDWWERKNRTNGKDNKSFFKSLDPPQSPLPRFRAMGWKRSTLSKPLFFDNTWATSRSGWKESFRRERGRARVTIFCWHFPADYIRRLFPPPSFSDRFYRFSKVVHVHTQWAIKIIVGDIIKQIATFIR